MLYFRYVSLLRQRSTTTTIVPDERSFETTTKDNFEEQKENISTKVSDEVFTTQPSIISTILFNTEPFTEIITSTTNDPKFTVAKSSETANTIIPTSDTLSTTEGPIFVAETVNDTISTTKAPTSTVTNVITSIYEAATERQRVRVKNIQNFLLEHKKTEPVTQSFARMTTASTTTLSTTMENVITAEEPTQKSILKGRFGGQAHFRPTLRKPIGTSEKSLTTDNIVETTTEKRVEATTEKKNRLNKYVNRFSRPTYNTESNTESISTTGKRFFRPTTESALGSSTRQPNRFRLTTSSGATENTSPLSRRNFSRFRSTTSEAPLTSSTELQKSRFFRGRKLNSPTSTSTTTTEVITTKELLSSEENGNSFSYETTTYTPSTVSFPSTNYEETSTVDEDFKITTVDSFEPVKYSTNEITTIQSTINKSFRGSIPNAFEDSVNDKPLRSPSSSRQNSRFLKDEKRIVYIRVIPSPDGRSQNELTSHPVKNITRNRGSIKAFDSLELNTLSDGLTEERPNELFRGSETNFRVRQSTTTESTEEV